MEGTGTGVVFETGDHTLMGQIAKMANSGRIKSTILQKEILKFTLIIAPLAIITGIICMIVWGTWLRVSVSPLSFLSFASNNEITPHLQYPKFLNISNMLSTDTGIIVAFVPCGFPIGKIFSKKKTSGKNKGRNQWLLCLC